MKSSSAFVCVALVACFAIYSNAEEENKVEWATILEKVNDIKNIVGGAITKIKATAEKDNKEVSANLAPKIDETVKQATALLEKAMNGLESKKLTEKEGAKLFAELQKVVVGVQAAAQPELGKLSKSAVNEIHTVFLSAYSQANMKAKEAVKLLAKSK